MRSSILALLPFITLGCGDTTPSPGNDMTKAADFSMIMTPADLTTIASPDMTVIAPPDLTLPPPPGDMAFTPNGSDYAGCVNYMDATQLARATILFGGNVLGMTYSPKCLKVRVTEPVDWSGSFAMHPLNMASKNAVAVTPVAGMNGVMTATFATPGFYGYFCGNHGSDDGQVMAGTIWSVN